MTRHGKTARFACVMLAMLCVQVIARAQGESSGDSTKRSFGMDAPLDVAAPLSPARIEAKAAGAGSAARTFGGNQSLGATVGGAQNIGFARQQIEAGRIPTAIDFPVEGLYSEHDIPTPSNDCGDRLCLSLGYGYAPLADSAPQSLLVHLGMGSNIRADEFRRLPQRLALVIDRSGSMNGGSMEAVKEALRRLAGKLDADDRICLVAFNDQAQLLLPMTSGAEREKILAAIDLLSAAGGTNIERGMILGYEELDRLGEESGVARRMMLFTDARPNVGRTDSGSFASLVRTHAAANVGLTAFGVGVNFGQELLNHISQQRGCNFFFLENSERIAGVFDSEFDYLVTPLLYDLDIEIETPAGMKLTAVYGLPWTPGERNAKLHVPTVFLSSNRGAIVLRYERDGAEPLELEEGDLLAVGRIAYTNVDMRRHESRTELRHVAAESLTPGTRFHTHEGMRIATALTNIYFGLRDGCALAHAGNVTGALAALDRARGLVALDNLQLQNDGLAKEMDLLTKLRSNIEGRVAVGK